MYPPLGVLRKQFFQSLTAGLEFLFLCMNLVYVCFVSAAGLLGEGNELENCAENFSKFSALFAAKGKITFAMNCSCCIDSEALTASATNARNARPGFAIHWRVYFARASARARACVLCVELVVSMKFV